MIYKFGKQAGLRMKKNVAYLFGAGASAVPVVKYFNKRLELFLKVLESYKRLEGISDFISDVQLILEESRNHSTIDTVAKKYFHSYDRNSLNLSKLKKVLIVFLLYEQLVDDAILKNPAWHIPDDILQKQKEDAGDKKGRIDKRYDSFIASLLKPVENNFIFPDEVGIITWNYDCQFELALRQFTNDSMYDLQKRLNIYPFFSRTAEKIHWEKISSPIFKIFHLNGQAHNYYKEQNKPIASFLDSQESIESILVKALKYIDEKSLTFSWEANSKTNLQYDEMKLVVDNSIKLINQSKILVIIGYSFPFFNREVDKALFGKKDFDKIYIQDRNADNLKELFINVFEPSINHKDVIAYENEDQFFLPPELDTDFPESISLAGFFG